MPFSLNVPHFFGLAADIPLIDDLKMIVDILICTIYLNEYTYIEVLRGYRIKPNHANLSRPPNDGFPKRSNSVLKVGSTLTLKKI